MRRNLAAILIVTGAATAAHAASPSYDAGRRAAPPVVNHLTADLIDCQWWRQAALIAATRRNSGEDEATALMWVRYSVPGVLLKYDPTLPDALKNLVAQVYAIRGQSPSWIADGVECHAEDIEYLMNGEREVHRGPPPS